MASGFIDSGVMRSTASPILDDCVAPEITQHLLRTQVDTLLLELSLNLRRIGKLARLRLVAAAQHERPHPFRRCSERRRRFADARSEEHTSALPSLLRISYAV